MWLDLDVILGDLIRWIEPSELQDFHVVSYVHGMELGVYVHGQFSFFNVSSQTVSSTWKKVTHLGRELEKNFRRKANDRKCDSYQYSCYNAEEGGFSYMLLNTAGIAAKLSQKASSVVRKTVVYVDGALRSCLKNELNCDLTSSWPPDKTVSVVAPPFSMHQEFGELEPLEFNEKSNCKQNWFVPQYRQCLKRMPVSRNLYRVEDQWFSRQYTYAWHLLYPRRVEVALFHLRIYKNKLTEYPSTWRTACSTLAKSAMVFSLGASNITSRKYHSLAASMSL